jgi:uncharacterized protein YceK
MVCLMAALTAGLGGCGTAANTLWLAPFEGGQRVYGGVRTDMEIVRQSITGEPESKGQSPRDRCITAVALAVDLPLSAVGDTLTLPYTVPAALLNMASKRDKLEWRPDRSEKPFSPP